MVQEGHWAIADAVMGKMKARGLGHPWGSGRAIQSLAGACIVDDWMQGLDERASNGEVRKLVMPVLNVSLDAVDVAGDREHQGFLKAVPEAYPVQGLGVLIEEVIKALSTQQWQQHPAAVTDQCMQEGAFEWRSTCSSLKMKRWRILLLTAHGTVMWPFLSVRLEWSTFPAVCILLAARIPRWLG